MNGLDRDLLPSCAEGEVGVCCSSTGICQYISLHLHMTVIPKWVSHDEECDIQLVCALEDLVAVLLDHISVCDDNGSSIVFFLAALSDSGQHTDLERNMGITYESLLVDEEDAGVGFEINSIRLFDDVEAFD